MHQATFTRRFSAAHRVAGDPGVCHRIHGHNYEAVITVTAPVLGPTGFVVPADDIKEVVDRRLDHKLILAADDPIQIGLPAQSAHPANDMGGTRLKNVEGSGWIVRVDSTPSTEVLAQLIADWVADVTAEHLADQDPRGIVVTVELRETPTIAARARCELERVERPLSDATRFLGRDIDAGA